ncbi:MAG: adenylate/guanylate cyclase domain-containing protein [Oscillospiraceae bacterium]|jgi:adenylate cyclase|nr:adenylate/guanylate cyclase domain-containing protein [Oscillospiraceae bacterium]
MRKDPFALRAALTAAALWVVCAALPIAGQPALIEYRLYDSLYQRVRPADTRIVLIGIDEPSLGRLGRWPWPRGIMADVVNILAEGGAAAVGIDVLYDTPSDPQEDALLAEAVANAQNVALAASGTFMRRTASVQSGYPEADGLVAPMGLFAPAAVAHVNAHIDPDSVVRRALYGLYYNGEFYPSLSRALAEMYRSRVGAPSAASPPLDGGGLYYVSYTGRAGWYRPVSFADVYEGKVPPRYFKDKVVLIGLTAAGVVSDWQFTSIDGEKASYGVEIHANMTQQLLEGRYITALPLPLSLAFFTLFAAVSALCSLRLRPLWGLAALAATLAAYGLAVYALVLMDITAPLTPAPLYCLAAYVAALVWHYARTRSNEKAVFDTFGRYMEPEVIRKILSEGEEGLKLGGQRRFVAVLFADARGFTALSEQSEPEEVVRLLNGCLDIASDCVRRRGGVLDKFIGDAVMAIWNAPYDTPNPALSAALAAVDIQRETSGMPVRFGIGINAGDAVIGNIGASFRMDYTAIGDTVNTAARLESRAKAGQILVSRSAAERIQGGGVALRYIGGMAVKGKTAEVEVFEVSQDPAPISV